eukprot:2885774-Amphidinium_carterae.1
MVDISHPGQSISAREKAGQPAAQWQTILELQYSSLGSGWRKGILKQKALSLHRLPTDLSSDVELVPYPVNFIKKGFCLSAFVRQAAVILLTKAVSHLMDIEVVVLKGREDEPQRPVGFPSPHKTGSLQGMDFSVQCVEVQKKEA